jgi:hypothetical protein
MRVFFHPEAAHGSSSIKILIFSKNCFEQYFYCCDVCTVIICDKIAALVSIAGTERKQ